jgi:hypothetical protein
MSDATVPAPGRETDSRVAEHVMNWRYDHEDPKWVQANGVIRAELPPFSLSTEATTELVQRMQQLGFAFTSATRHQTPPQAGMDWMAGFASVEKGTIRGDAATEAHAICVAALKAVGAI